MPAVEPASQAEINAMLDGQQPQLLALIGLGGIFVIIALMRFKPF